MAQTPVQPARAGMGSAVRAIAHEGVRGDDGGVDGPKMGCSPPGFSSTAALCAQATEAPPDEVHVKAMGRARCPLGCELHRYVQNTRGVPHP